MKQSGRGTRGRGAAPANRGFKKSQSMGPTTGGNTEMLQPSGSVLDKQVIDQLLQPLHDKFQKLRLDVNKHTNELEIQKNSISSLEMGECERSILIRNVPMSHDRESPDQTLDALAPLWACMGLTLRKDIHIYSIARLGAFKPDQKFPPQIRVKFMCPADKSVFNSRVTRMADDPVVRTWSCTSELPSVLKKVSQQADTIAFQLRKQTPGLKTQVKYRRKTAVVLIKSAGGTWVEASEAQCTDALERYNSENPKTSSSRGRGGRGGGRGGRGGGKGGARADAAAEADVEDATDNDQTEDEAAAAYLTRSKKSKA